MGVKHTLEQDCSQEWACNRESECLLADSDSAQDPLGFIKTLGMVGVFERTFRSLEDLDVLLML